MVRCINAYQFTVFEIWRDFLTNKTPSGAEKHHESTESENTKTTKLFFFFVFFRSFFRRASSILRQSLVLVTHETAAFYTEHCTTPLLFPNFEVSQGACSHSLKHYGFQFGTPFSSFLLTHAHLRIT